MPKTTRDKDPVPMADEPVDPAATHPDGHCGPDPANAPIEQLLAPLDEDDDVHERLRQVNTEDTGDARC